jgi:hypothetical protein
MARVSLDHCQVYQLPLLSVKDYIEAFRDKFGILLPAHSVRKYIKIGVIDHVYHEGRYYIVIEDKSMESLPIPFGYKLKGRTKKGGKIRWVKNR